MSVPAHVRRRWGLTDGGRLTVIDLGDAVVLLPAGTRQKLLGEALTAEATPGHSSRGSKIPTSRRPDRDGCCRRRSPVARVFWTGTRTLTSAVSRRRWRQPACGCFASRVRGRRPSWPGSCRSQIAALSADQQQRFRSLLVALPDAIEVLPLRGLAWPMAELQQRAPKRGSLLSAAMAEALAAAHALHAAIAVSREDVGPNLQAAAEHDGIVFHIV